MDSLLSKIGFVEKKTLTAAEYNIKTWVETVKYCQKHFSDNKLKSTKLRISEIKNNQENHFGLKFIPLIEVINDDTITVALRLKNEGYDPLVLIMMNPDKKGGHLDLGLIAQEEEVYKKTNICMYHDQNIYPLNKDEFLYSPEVTVIRDQKYEILPKKHQEQFSMISVAAIYKPKLVDGIYIQEDYDLMYDKIEIIFLTAIKYNKKSLVLGVLGCGMFRNPPLQVCKIYTELIQKYGKNFQKITFAILDRNPLDINSNFKIFNDRFSNFKLE